MSDPHEPRQIGRRTLLKGAVAGGAAIVAGSFGVARLLRSREKHWDPNAFPEPGRAYVAVLPAASYDGPLETLVLEDSVRSGQTWWVRA